MSLVPSSAFCQHLCKGSTAQNLWQYRTKSVWRLCTPSACKFPFRACFVSSRTHLSHKLCAVLPYAKSVLSKQTQTINICSLLYHSLPEKSIRNPADFAEVFGFFTVFLFFRGKRCIKLVRKMRHQISGPYDEKSASRLRAKPSGRLYAVLPEFTKSFSIPSGMKWLKQISACKPFTDLSF